VSGKKDSELVSYPSSKIVSWNVSAGHEEAAFVLCEDGSVWSYFYNAFHPSGFRLLVAAELKKECEHAADLAEALDALQKLNDVDIDDEYGVQQAIFKNADRVLQKHGMQVFQQPKSES
jgi:hypothetical protein